MSLSPSPLRAALLAQIVAGIIVAALMHWVTPALSEMPLAAAALQGVCAAVISHRLGAAKWWLPIHCIFLPAVILAGRLEIAAGWYLAAFVLLLLIYWRTDQSRVPLYLSNALTAQALIGLLPPQPCQVIDLGCGHGGLLRHLARARRDCHFLGIEHAPLPWLWARLASIAQPNLQIRYGDFWQHSLAPYDIVYAFLSPVPMPRLMDKASGEMRPGALLVSNSFVVPGRVAERIVTVADRRATQLHCYRL